MDITVKLTANLKDSEYGFGEIVDIFGGLTPDAKREIKDLINEDIGELLDKCVWEIKSTNDEERKVYEFLYNGDFMDTPPRTMSIHRTPEGAEKAMNEHKEAMRKEAEEDLEDGYESNFSWDYNQWWGVRESDLLE